MGCVVHAVEGAVKGVAHAVGGAVEGVAKTVGDVATGNFGAIPGDVIGDALSIAGVMNPESLLMDAVVGGINGATGSQSGGAILGMASQVAALV